MPPSPDILSVPFSGHTTAMDPLTLYTQVFLLLVAEMALFMLLVLPMPFAMKRRMFTYVIPPTRKRRHSGSLDCHRITR